MKKPYDKDICASKMSVSHNSTIEIPTSSYMGSGSHSETLIHFIRNPNGHEDLRKQFTVNIILIIKHINQFKTSKLKTHTQKIT